MVKRANGIVFTLLLLFTALAVSGYGANVSWINQSGGVWSNPDNWRPARVPGDSDNVFIIVSGLYTVNLDVNTTVGSLTLGGTSGKQTLSIDGHRMDVLLSGSIDNAGTMVLRGGSVLGGKGRLMNAGWLDIDSSRIEAGLVNDGDRMRVRRQCSITGSFTNTVEGVVEISGSYGAGNALLTVIGGFTNSGAVLLRGDHNGDTLSTASIVVTSGALVNDGSLIVGGTSPNLTHSLKAELINRGRIQIIDSDLELVGARANHVNNGSIRVAAGQSMRVEMPSSASSFSTSGRLEIDSGAVFSVAGGLFDFRGGVIENRGRIEFSDDIRVGLTDDFPISAGSTVRFFKSEIDGPGALINEGRLELEDATVNADVVNRTNSIEARSANSINGRFENHSDASLRIVGSWLYGDAVVRFANGFENAGTIQLWGDESEGLAGTASCIVESGSLVNSGAINSSGTEGTAHHLLNAELVNSGNLVVSLRGLTIRNDGASHSNTGTISVAENRELRIDNRTELPSSFSTSGTIEIDDEAVLSVAGGSFTLFEGDLTNNGTVLFERGATATLFTDHTNKTMFIFENAVLNGPGAFINEGRLSLTSSEINADLRNDRGQIDVRRECTINGDFENRTNGKLEIIGSGSAGNAVLTCASGFTNAGRLELVGDHLGNSVGTATCVVESGKILNLGSITSSGSVADGQHALTASLDNRGNLIVDTRDLLINAEGVDHKNSGTITIAQHRQLGVAVLGGSLVSGGNIHIDSDAALSVEKGLFENSRGGIIGGQGKISLTEAEFTNSGSLSPGDDVGDLEIEGGVTAASASVLDVQLGGLEAGREYDRIEVTSIFGLGGTLNVSLVDGFEPVVGDSFQVLTFGSSTGNFDKLNVESQGSGFHFDVRLAEDGLWLVTRATPNVPPEIEGFPDTLSIVAGIGDVLSVWDFVADIETPDSALSYSFEIGNDSVTAYYDQSIGSLTIGALASFAGETELAFTVQDFNLGMATDTVVISVLAPTEIEEESGPELPNDFSLSQNYPNPFNPATMIEYTVPVQSYVTLIVYNILGQEINVLVARETGPGRYQSIWDGTDTRGQLVSGGIYFYRLQSDNYVATRKMVLLK